jgi:hypothetical protein
MRRRHASVATATNTPQDATVPPDREAGITPPRDKGETLRVYVRIQQLTHGHRFGPVTEGQRTDGSVDVVRFAPDMLVMGGK